MSVVTDNVAVRPVRPASKGFTLAPAAESQMIALGIDAADVISVIRMPDKRQPSVHPGRERWFGEGLVLVIENCQVLNVYIDGAKADNWEAAARRRAKVQARHTEEIKKNTLVYSTETGAISSTESVDEFPDHSYVYAVPAMPRGESKDNPVTRRNLLDGVHPALRREVLNQLAGDFSRLHIISPTRVEIANKSA